MAPVVSATTAGKVLSLNQFEPCSTFFLQPKDIHFRSVNFRSKRHQDFLLLYKDEVKIAQILVPPSCTSGIV